jgi:GNAT superfamily N-acetyltransferase
LQETSTEIRALGEADIPDAVEISTAAGWNQTAADWRMLIAVAPTGCIAVTIAGRVVATATLVCYGTRLGWIGMVLTRTEFRGLGFASRLLTKLLADADALGIESVKLDATEQGQPIYEKLGFRAEQPVERWVATAPVLRESPISDEERRSGWTDVEAFGADRRELLAALAMYGVPTIAPEGFAYSRPGREAMMLGPCVASGASTAESVITERLRKANVLRWYWDILPENRHAAALADSLGFSPSRRLLRMVRGRECRGTQKLIFATAGFELG